MPDQVTRLTITRDMAIRALKHVEEGTYPPPDAPREDLMAVQYLLWKESERLRAEKAELRRPKEEADAASAWRAAYSFTAASTEVSSGARRGTLAARATRKPTPSLTWAQTKQIGRASCRERVCQYV